MTTDPSTLAEQGKQAFSARKFDQAAEFFSRAVSGYNAAKDTLNAAEMKNNLSVALLKAGKAQEAYEAVAGTDKIFGEAGDIRRQGMAIGNQAAALEAIGQVSEALAAYERSVVLLTEIKEKELRSIVLQAIAIIKLRQGKVMDAAFSMIGSIDSAPNPTLWQRFLQILLRFIS